MVYWRWEVISRHNDYSALTRLAFSPGMATKNLFFGGLLTPAACCYPNPFT